MRISLIIETLENIKDQHGNLDIQDIKQINCISIPDSQNNCTRHEVSTK